MRHKKMDTEKIWRWLRSEADIEGFYQGGFGEYDDPPYNSVVLNEDEQAFARSLRPEVISAWLWGMGKFPDEQFQNWTNH